MMKISFRTLEPFAVALVFAAIFLYGGRLHRPGGISRRGLLSFAAGISVAYVFVDCLPALSRVKEFQTRSGSEFPMLFPEYSVYLWAMFGFLIFYGLERLVCATRSHGEGGIANNENPPGWEFWLHVGGFAAYAWLLTFLLGHGPGLGWVGVTFYAVAMGLHLLPVTHNLVREYGRHYERVGSWVLAASALAGGVCSLLLNLPGPVLAILIALVAGGVIVNTMITELPGEKEGKVLPFFGGAVFYAALLICLSNLEAGG
jgi:hypothetical protein